MKIFAVKEHEAVFDVSSSALSGGFLNAETTIRPVLGAGDDCEAALQKEELLELQEIFETGISSKPAYSIELKFLKQDLDGSGNPVEGGVENPGVGSSQQMVRVDGGFLEELEKLYDDFRVKVTIEGIRWPEGYNYNSRYGAGRLPQSYGQGTTKLTTSEMQLTIGKNAHGARKVYWEEKITLPSLWSSNLNLMTTGQLRQYGIRQFCMWITIEIMTPLTTVEPFSVYKRMLAEKIGTDAILIAKCDCEIKCHKGILSTHSAVLARMFESGFMETRTSKIELNDMSKEGINAFLEYLYYWGTDEPEKNSSVALELFEAGHKYDVAPLEKKAKKILLRKRNDWYDVNVALRLFLFARNLEGGENLVTKSLQVLKSKFEELEASEEYKNLFETDRKAAMKLCALAFSA